MAAMLLEWILAIRMLNVEWIFAVFLAEASHSGGWPSIAR